MKETNTVKITLWYCSVILYTECGYNICKYLKCSHYFSFYLRALENLYLLQVLVIFHNAEEIKISKLQGEKRIVLKCSCNSKNKAV